MCLCVPMFLSDSTFASVRTSCAYVLTAVAATVAVAVAVAAAAAASYNRFSPSTRTFVTSLCGVYCLRRPLRLFLERLRLFGLLLLFPLCLQLVLELLDHRVSWRLYFGRERERERERGATAPMTTICQELVEDLS